MTDKLQSEEHLCREMRTKYTEMEETLLKTKERLQLKDDEMIRMAHEATELNRQILIKDQELDRLRHYEASGESESHLQAELQNAQITVGELQKKIAELELKIPPPIQKPISIIPGRIDDESNDELSTIEEGREVGEVDELLKEIELLRTEKAEMMKVINNFHTKVPQPPQNDVKTQVSVVQSDAKTQAEVDQTDAKIQAEITQVTQETQLNGDEIPSRAESRSSILPPEEALERLQEKFRRTMNDVERLTEERDRLEHLVLQLQFETETIGEYITLYQTQRRQLKQKDLERDRQLQQLALDREKMKEKLLELNTLIEQLLVEKRRRLSSVSENNDHGTTLTNGNSESVSHPSSPSPAGSPVPPISEASTGSPVEQSVEGVVPKQLVRQVSLKSKLDTKETAKKILALLSDIQTANQESIQHSIGVDHCACCQGKLDVV